MIEQKAIEEFNLLKKTRMFIPHNNTIDIAINALEKQIPKKWVYEEVNDCDIYVCPYCNEYWYLEGMNPTQSEYNYCPNCGQAIKWE